MQDALHKIVFVGTTGAGKTTAIHSISDIEPLTTDVENMHGEGGGKATTTVALDYGKVYIDDDNVLSLFGTPGQQRFSFMWPIVCKNALGLVLMVNNKEEDCLAQIQWYADKFRTQLNEIPAVLAITQTDVAKTPTTKDYKRVLKEKGITIPVFSIDARKKSDVLIILNAVLSMNEAEL